MPLAHRTIQPVWLGRRPLSEEEKEEELVQIAVSHNGVLGAIVQLASLVRHADDIFCDLAEECQAVFEKTESIIGKVQNVERIIRTLDSTEVQIPVGTLKQFSEVTEHHVAKHGFECDHFTPTNRPHCVRFQYTLCETTPVHALRGADMYRKDGLYSSHLFKLWPIALKDTARLSDEMTLPKGVVNTHLRKKKYKRLELRQRPKTIHSIDEIFQESEMNTQEGNLRAAKKDNLSKSQPSFTVPVNTSGEGFERMASFRQSLKEDRKVGEGEEAVDEEGRRKAEKKRRRRTVSGVPTNIMQEIEQFERGRRIDRNRPRQYSLDDLDPKELEERDRLMQQYLLEIDAQIAEREEMEYAQQREAKLLKFLPCRRSRSLPRCVRLMSAVGKVKDSTLTRSSLYEKNKSSKVPSDEVRPRQPASGITRQPASGITPSLSNSASIGSLSSSGGGGRASRSAKRSSLIGNKIRSFVSGTLKPRPKSLDFDAIETEKDDETDKGHKPVNRSVSLGRVNSHAMPEENLTRTASSESQVGPGSYYYFDNNTIPRAQAKKYDFPWDSLPKDWTTSVKLREISKRRKEDRQSSSGNWSQSGYSSNRQSMDSDVKSSMPSTTSQHSLGRDSGRDSPLLQRRDTLDTGYMGDAASSESISETKSMSNADSDDWIRSLAERAASRGDVTSTSADALANLSRLTKQNIRNLDILVPGRSSVRRKRNELEDDGESSVYSLDQEGFYTSFHNDSGLRRSSNTLLEDEDDDLMMPRMRETKSLQSVTSFSTMESVIFKPENEGGVQTVKSSSVSSPNLACPLYTAPTISDFQESDIPDIDAPEDNGNTLDAGDTGTLKAKKKKDKKRPPPPPPPRRTSSIRRSGVNCADSSISPSSDKNQIGPLGESPETSSESSDHETISARLKTKTNISARTFPSWCAGIVSDDDDFAPRDTLSASQERLNAESSELEEMCQFVLSGTVPRPHKETNKLILDDVDYTANSWPRVKRLETSGILKTPEKDKAKISNAGNPKTLNFAPVVNLFDAKSPHGVPMPLSRMSSSDESSSATSTFMSAPSYKLSLPPTDFSEDSQTKGASDKKVHTVTSQNVSSKFVSASPGTPGYKPGNSSSQLSGAHSKSSPSISSIDSFDAPLAKPLGACDKSSDTLSSNSTIALSDFDSSSLTHVSLTDSTPSGSTLSLNWDTDDTPNPTPSATPVRKLVSEKSAKSSCKSPRHDHNGNLKLSSTPAGITKYSRGRSPAKGVAPKAMQEEFSLSFPSPSSSSSVPAQATLSSVKPVMNSSVPSSSKSALISAPPETGPVLLSAPRISSTSIKSGGNISVPVSTCASAMQQSMKPNSYGTIIPPNSSSINLSTARASDKKPNIINKDSYVKYPNASVPKSTSWSRERNNLNLMQSGSKEQPFSSNITHPQSWSTASAPYKGISSAAEKTERRRSSPVLAENSRGVMSTSSGYNFPTGEVNKSDLSFSKRRQSGGSLHSPADSGFGSPGFNQPCPVVPIQPFSYPSVQQQQQESWNSSSSDSSNSKVPLIKKPLLKDSKSSPHLVQKQFPGSSGSQFKADHNLKTHSHSSSSSESLSSQFSMASSTNHLLGKKGKTDLSQPVMRSGHSSESLHSNSSAGRSDSYRVALLAECDETSLVSRRNSASSTSTHNDSSVKASESSSSRPTLRKSLSGPASNYTDDGISRADSYRCAVRNTQSAVLGDVMARNSSYRLATCEDSVVVTDSRMDACNLWTGKTGGTRDMRRMGITDVDQLKNYNDSDVKVSSKRNTSKTAATLHVRKKLAVKPDNESLLSTSSKTPPTDHKRLVKTNSKDKGKNNKTQSSTYIRFDPIFESGEDLRASSESLRPPSITSVRTLARADSNDTLTAEKAQLVSQKASPVSPVRKRSSSQGRRSFEDRSGLSLLGSIKTTIKSIGGSKGE
ncbi:mucin-5AC [Aplysia californica]|uniref:Mucin-5AC n=1 Tax=Aplysia californica TaxID=6500 RepID=A0ABM1AAP3_APLCA|nr:mucin-5AC [Aplysia californica]